MGTPVYINPATGSDSNSGASALQARATPPAATDNTDFLFCDDTHYIRSGQWSWGTAVGCTLGRYSPNGRGEKPKITIDASASTNAINIQGAGEHVISEVQLLDCKTSTNGGVLGSGLVAATGKGANLRLVGVVGRRCNWNFVRLGTFTTQAADTFRMLGCDLEDIGEDGVFGGAQVLFEVAYSRIVRPGINTNTGDCVGFFNADPALVWVHHNHLEHPGNTKQVVIVDTTTAQFGKAVIEDNVMIGYTGPNCDNQAVVNSESQTTLRRNYIKGSGILATMGADGSFVEGNVFEVRGYRPVNLPINASLSVYASNASVHHNVFVADQVYDQSATGYLFATGSGRTNNSFKNNIIVNVAKAVYRNTRDRSCSLQQLPVQRNNALRGQHGDADLWIGGCPQDPLFLDPDRPWLGLRPESPCWHAGAFIQGAKDRYGRMYSSPSHIGPWAIR